MNVVVLSLPGLRPHHLGCYGNEWVATPALDRLAAQGVVFDRHYADLPGAPPEFRPEWTGLSHHGMINHANVMPECPPRTLRQLMEEHGVICAFPEALPPPSVDDGSPWAVAFRLLPDRVGEMPGNRPWLLWAAAPSLAPPWKLPDEVLTAYFDEDEEPEPWRGTACGPVEAADELFDRLHRTYAAVVTHVDGALEELFDRLQGLPAFDQALLIVTGERGLALGEHGIVGDYRPWLHDELVHLPLLLRLPDAAQAGRRVAALTQPVDLFATVLEAFGMPATESASHSLLLLARGEGQPPREFAITTMRVGDALEASLRTRDWAYLLPLRQPSRDAPRAPQLYAKPEDVWEVNDVRHHHPELAEQLEQQLRAHLENVARGGADEHREIGG